MVVHVCLQISSNSAIPVWQLTWPFWHLMGAKLGIFNINSHMIYLKPLKFPIVYSPIWCHSGSGFGQYGNIVKTGSLTVVESEIPSFCIVNFHLFWYCASQSGCLLLTFIFRKSYIFVLKCFLKYSSNSIIYMCWPSW